MRPLGWWFAGDWGWLSCSCSATIDQVERLDLFAGDVSVRMEGAIIVYSGGVMLIHCSDIDVKMGLSF